MQAVIMAGGRGTRLEALTKGEIPKPMVPIMDRPLLLWQIEQLKAYNITHITMIVGYLGDKIMEYFKDGHEYGCEIDYIVEEEPLGTAGALSLLKPRLSGQHFMMVFGDVFFNFDISKMEKFHEEHQAQVTLFAHPNIHPYDSDLICTDNADRVTKFDSKHNDRSSYWYDNCVNAGLYIMNTSICDKVPTPVKTDLEHEVLAKMIEDGEAVYAYKSPEYVKDVGTVDRITKTIEDIKSGFIDSKNLKNKQRCVFLDRDGVINKEVGFLSDINQMELMPGSAEAIGRINSSGYLAIVITNQPVIARGACSLDELHEIHNKLKTLLGREGVYIDDLYYCPHHPHKGFEGERVEYKIECECRKPKTGMIDKAVARYNIDTSKSYMIGDATTDIECGRRAGCKTVLVKTGRAGEDGICDVTPDMVAPDLRAAVDMILK